MKVVPAARVKKRQDVGAKLVDLGERSHKAEFVAGLKVGRDNGQRGDANNNGSYSRQRDEFEQPLTGAHQDETERHDGKHQPQGNRAVPDAQRLNPHRDGGENKMFRAQVHEELVPEHNCQRHGKGQMYVQILVVAGLERRQREHNSSENGASVAAR